MTTDNEDDEGVVERTKSSNSRLGYTLIKFTYQNGKIKMQKLIKMYQLPPKLFFVLVVLIFLMQKIMFLSPSVLSSQPNDGITDRPL